MYHEQFIIYKRCIHIDILRLLLAALHYNYNSKKQQAKTKKGEEQYAILYPKYKKGGFVVRKVNQSEYG